MSEKTGDNTFRVEPQSLQKTPTKIEGLDEVLHGGLPTGRLSIISGGPGAGKTVVGLEILVRGTELGQPAIFISFEEEKEKIQRNAQAMGWDLVSLEKAEKLAMINPEIDYKAAFSGEFNIDGLFAILKGQAQRIGAKMIVIDAVDMLMRMFKDPVQARNQIIELHRWLSEQNLTAVMTVKAKDNDHEEYDYLDFMADCVIKLDQRTHDQVTTRRLHVIKYRGSDFSSREHPFVITDEGVVVMPLPFIDLVPRSKGQLISTGNLKMDEILGGGYRKGASILISGPSGSGKTTMAFTISSAAAKRGERVLYMSFEQSEMALISEMQSLGLNLEPLIKKGTLQINAVMPESMVMEEHLHHIVQDLENYKPELLILDAISATARIGSEQAAKDFLIRLYHAAKKRNITCTFTNQTFSPKEDELKLSGLGISSLVDTAIILNYFRERESIGRTMLVLKSRGTNHSNKYHEFYLTDNGIRLANSVNM